MHQPDLGWNLLASERRVCQSESGVTITPNAMDVIQTARTRRLELCRGMPSTSALPLARCAFLHNRFIRDFHRHQH